MKEENTHAAVKNIIVNAKIDTGVIEAIANTKIDDTMIESHVNDDFEDEWRKNPIKPQAPINPYMI
jgi:hypothetical protein